MKRRPQSLAEQRESLGLTQGQVAALAKCGQGTVSKAEQGGQVGDKLKKSLAKAVGVSVKKWEWLQAMSIEYPLFEWAMREAAKREPVFLDTTEHQKAQVG